MNVPDHLFSGRRVIAVLILTVVLPGLGLRAQPGGPVIPLLPDLSNVVPPEAPVRVLSQDLVIFLYQNAAGVMSRSEVETGNDDSTVFVFSYNNGRWVSGDPEEGPPGLRIEVGSRALSALITPAGPGGWNIVLPPNQRIRIEAMFWVPTLPLTSFPPDSLPLEKGERSLIIARADEDPGSAPVEDIHIFVVLQDGLSAEDEAVEVNPPGYLPVDSVLTWTGDAVPSAVSDPITIHYGTGGLPPAGLRTLAAIRRFMEDTMDARIREFLEER